MGVQPLVYSYRADRIAQLDEFMVRDIEDAIEKGPSMIRQIRKAMRRFPRRDGDLLAVGTFVSPSGGSAEVAREDDRPAWEEEVPRREEEVDEPREEEPDQESVSFLDLDRDNAFDLSDSDAGKRLEDQEGQEKGLDEVEYKPIYAEWWFWTIIGVVVAGGAITTAVMLKPDGPDSSRTMAWPTK